MKTKVRKGLVLFLAVPLFLSAVTGCKVLFLQGKSVEKKEKVTIGLWGSELTRKYSQYLCERFPEVEFDFQLATNSLDYYRYRNDHDDLPDIMTIRRFSQRDAVILKDKLYDLSNTKLAATYDDAYLDMYTYEDGTVNWLPACAEVDSIIANKTLFVEHHIPIPTDYESFISACESFEADGIRGFLSDYGSDYTCMETLQGFSVSKLLSMEGREWRVKYESGATNQLSDNVWMPVFEKFFDMKEKTGLGTEETAMSNHDPKELYMEGKLAMYRGTGTDVIDYPGREGDESILLPYFGNTAKDNWYLTYPAFQVAAAKKGMENPKREALILDIMSAMLDKEGQMHISYGKNMISYNDSVSLELLPELSNLNTYIADNKLYIRLASDEMFRVSMDVVQEILKGELTTPQEAFDTFNEKLLKRPPEDPAVCHIENAYSSDFLPEGGSKAASAVFNTVRKEAGADLLLAQNCYVGGDVYAGDYTEKEISYLIKSDGGVGPVLANLTGDQLYRLVQNILKTGNRMGSVCNESTLYVSSGFEMKLIKDENGYTLDRLTIQGKELDRKAVYSVLLQGDRDWIISHVMKDVGCETYESLKETCDQLLKKRLIEENGKLETPQAYITITEPGEEQEAD